MLSLTEQYYSPLRKRQRRIGSALVELISGMTCLFMMIGLLLWIGFASIHISELVIETRTENWNARYEKRSLDKANPFRFEQAGEISLTNQDRVNEIGTFFDSFPSFSSTNHVNCGAWDHRQLNLNRTPNWLYCKEIAFLSQPQKIKLIANAFPPDYEQFRSVLERAVVEHSKDKLLKEVGPAVDQILGINTSSSLMAINEDSKKRSMQRQQDVESQIIMVRDQLTKSNDRLTEVSQRIKSLKIILELLNKDLMTVTADKQVVIKAKVKDTSDKISSLESEQYDLFNKIIPAAHVALEKLEDLLRRLKKSPEGN